MNACRYAGSCLAFLALLIACSDTPDREIPASEAAEMDAAEADGPRSSSLQTALDLQQTFSAVAKQVLPSVVGISAYRQLPGQHGRARTGWQEASKQGHPGFVRTGVGSGFVVSADGYLFTAYSVITEIRPFRLPDRIEVEILDEKLPARLVGAEPTINLAVLKIEPAVELQPVSLAEAGSISVGHWAIAVGDPPGAGTTFATGSVSARPERECYQEERTATLIQSSARVPPGGWGGPLVNIRGQVIGISQPPPPGEALREAFGSNSDFALPISLAMTIYEPLLARESRRSPWLGVSVRRIPLAQQPPPALGSRRGILIDDVFEPSPASKEGIRAGDIMLTMAGEEIATVASFQRWLYLKGIGASVKLQVFRDGEFIWREMTIEERPPSATMR